MTVDYILRRTIHRPGADDGYHRQLSRAGRPIAVGRCRYIYIGARRERERSAPLHASSPTFCRADDDDDGLGLIESNRRIGSYLHAQLSSRLWRSCY